VTSLEWLPWQVPRVLDLKLLSLLFLQLSRGRKFRQQVRTYPQRRLHPNRVFLDNLSSSLLFCPSSSLLSTSLLSVVENQPARHDATLISQTVPSESGLLLPWRPL